MLHEAPLCGISKATKLSPLAVVWTLVLWELVCLVYLFVVMVSEGRKRGGGDPPTQLALGSRETGGQVIQRRSVKGSSLSQPRFGGCANFVTDGLVWLPRPALLKSPCPVSIHQKHVYEPKLGGWAVGIKEKLLLKAEDYKRNNNPASQDDLC